MILEENTTLFLSRRNISTIKVVNIDENEMLSKNKVLDNKFLRWFPDHLQISSPTNIPQKCNSQSDVWIFVAHIGARKIDIHLP
jgi:hypothetical protein